MSRNVCPFSIGRVICECDDGKVIGLMDHEYGVCKAWKGRCVRLVEDDKVGRFENGKWIPF